MTATVLHVTTIPMSLTFLRGQVGYMKQRGLRVYAVSSPGPDLDGFARDEDVEVAAVEMPRRITPLRDLRATMGLVSVMRRFRPDVVHAHTPKGGLLGMIAARIWGARVRIYHMRGLPATGATGWKRHLLLATERVACGLAHSVICVSHSVRQQAIEEGLCPAVKIHVILGGSGNGVDAHRRFSPAALPDGTRHGVRSEFGIPADAVVIGFVGRVVRDKGVVELVEAWRRLRERHPAAFLLLVGPFEPQDPLPADAAALLHSDDRVRLVGMDWDTPRLYAAMDLVVLPTYREGFPNVPLEAAAMELPVVATRIPGCTDAVQDAVTGMLIPPRDAAALEEAVSSYVADPALRRRHGAAGRERVVREFRPEGIWAGIHAEYTRLLRLHGRVDSGPVDDAEEKTTYTAAGT